MKTVPRLLAAAIVLALASFAQSGKNDSKPAGGAASGDEKGLFTGKSVNASLQEALNDALQKAQLALSKNVADARFEYRVETIRGVRGGIAGTNEITVDVRIVR
jgi:hypothetical protein